MAGVLMHDLHGLPHFDVSDVTGIASKWQNVGHLNYMQQGKG